MQTAKQRMPLGIRAVAQYPPTNVIRDGQRVPCRGKTPERWSYPPPGHPGEDDEQNSHGEPRHTVVVAFARMSNEGISRGKRRKKEMPTTVPPSWRLPT